VAERLARARSAATFHVAAIGQTFFVENPRVGLAAIAVLAVAAPRLAASGLAVSVVARLVAARIGAPRDFLVTGLVELNGWFLGLALATFFPTGVAFAIALAAGGPVIAATAIVMRRLFATWDIPVFVGPYLPAFWLLFAALSSFPWGTPTDLLAAAPPPAGSPAMTIALGGLRGLGEIFFIPDARVGVALAVAVSLGDRRAGIGMILASTAAVSIGYFAGAPTWQVEQGLAGFTPALVTAAALCRFAGLGPTAVAIAIVSGAFVEAGVLRIAAGFGLFALSTSYLLFVWVFALLRPVRDAAADRRGWSSTAAARPRLFDDG
jgi:urea transporter